MFDAFTHLQEPVTYADVTAYLQRLESEIPPDEYEALARALMQRLIFMMKIKTDSINPTYGMSQSFSSIFMSIDSHE